MPTDGVARFWSYAHADNARDGDKLTKLADDLMAEFEMLSGDALTLFVDRSSLQWGDEWRLRIGEALDTTTFSFLSSHRFFRSEECRRELLRFGGQARSLGIEELIMPLLYVSVDLEAESPDEARHWLHGCSGMTSGSCGSWKRDLPNIGAW